MTAFTLELHIFTLTWLFTVWP